MMCLPQCIKMKFVYTSCVCPLRVVPAVTTKKLYLISLAGFRLIFLAFLSKIPADQVQKSLELHSVGYLGGGARKGGPQYCER